MGAQGEKVYKVGKGGRYGDIWVYRTTNVRVCVCAAPFLHCLVGKVLGSGLRWSRRYEAKEVAVEWAVAREKVVRRV